MVILRDYEETEFKGYELLPNGTYLLEVERVENKMAKSGNPGLNFQFNVCEGDFANQKVFKTFWFMGSTPEKTKTLIGMFKGFLKTLGLEKEERDSIDTDNSVPIFNICYGRKIKAVVGKTAPNENGKEYNEIKSFEPVATADLPF